MRIAAWALIVVAAFAGLWFFAVAEMLIVPGAGGNVMHDGYYEVAAARSALPTTLLALLNGTGALLLRARRRPGALWIVLGAGVLLLIAALWHYPAIHAASGARIPDHVDASVAAAQRSAFFRASLFWTGLGFTLVGWAAWAVNRRIEIGHGRD